MFLHYILNQDKTKLISRVFWAQVRKPVPNDWAIIVREDMEEFGIVEKFEEIASISKKAWKDQVKEAVTEKAFKYLKDQIQGRGLSKIKDLVYSELKLQTYLTGSDYSTTQKKFAFRLRSRMVQVGHNFGNKDLCPLCHIGANDQLHLSECVVLKVSMPELMDNACDFKYEEIYGEDPAGGMNVTAMLHKSFQKRE